MPNVALIKHDGSPLNMPAATIQAIFPMNPTEDATEVKTVLVTSFRGYSAFLLQDDQADVFESVMNQLPKELQKDAAHAWIKLESFLKWPEGSSDADKGTPRFIYLACMLVEGYDGIKADDTQEPVLRLWLNNRTGHELLEFCKDTEENRAALARAVTWREGQA